MRPRPGWLSKTPKSVSSKLRNADTKERLTPDMARVKTQKKSSHGQKVTCGRCLGPINPGDQYRKVSLKTGPRSSVTKYRCMGPACGFRSSELTTSRMSEVYQLNERLEDACSGLRLLDKTQRLTPARFEEFKSDLESIRDDAQSLAEEFQEAYDNMPEQFQSGENGERTQARQEAVEEFANELDSAIDNVSWPDVEDEDDVEDTLACKVCTMAKGDDRHTKGHEDFDHAFEAPDPTPEQLEALSESVESVVSEFERMSIDCE